jgi:integrase
MMTFQEVLLGFIEYSRVKACYRTYCRLRDQYFLDWMEHPTFAQIEDWHRGLAHVPHHSNKGLSMLKAMFTWAMRRGHYPGPNPATGVKRHPTHSRERVMTSQEIALLLNTLDMLPQKISTILLVLLLTGCRLGEAREMQWVHLT